MRALSRRRRSRLAADDCVERRSQARSAECRHVEAFGGATCVPFSTFLGRQATSVSYSARFSRRRHPTNCDQAKGTRRKTAPFLQSFGTPVVSQTPQKIKNQTVSATRGISNPNCATGVCACWRAAELPLALRPSTRSTAGHDLDRSAIVNVQRSALLSFLDVDNATLEIVCFCGKVHLSEIPRPVVFNWGIFIKVSNLGKLVLHAGGKLQ